MQTITKTITLYTISELSDRAKNKALENWVSGNDYAYGGENKETLYKFAETLDLKIKDYRYGSYSSNDGVTWELHKDYENEIMTLSGIRLLSYLENNIGDTIRTGKYYSLYSKTETMEHYPTMGNIKRRESKVIFTHDCPLTGYCMDMSILDPIYEFIKSPTDKVTFEDLINYCMDAWVSACVEDMEYQNSMESFIEACESNGYTFTEDGEMENI